MFPALHNHYLCHPTNNIKNEKKNFYQQTGVSIDIFYMYCMVYSARFGPPSNCSEIRLMISRWNTEKKGGTILYFLCIPT